MSQHSLFIFINLWAIFLNIQSNAPVVLQEVLQLVHLYAWWASLGKVDRGLVVLAIFFLVDWGCSGNENAVSTDNLIFLRSMAVFAILLKQFRASVVEYGRADFVLFCNGNWGLDCLSVWSLLWERSGVFRSPFEGAHGMLERELLLPLAGRLLKCREGILSFGGQRVVLDRLLADCLLRCWKAFLAIVHLWKH